MLYTEGQPCYNDDAWIDPENYYSCDCETYYCSKACGNFKINNKIKSCVKCRFEVIKISEGQLFDYIIKKYDISYNDLKKFKQEIINKIKLEHLLK